jgi:DNA-binding transcriptional MocR family regulator
MSGAAPAAAQKEIPAGMIDLGIGQPSPGLLPVAEIERAAADCTGRREPGLLAYGFEQGEGRFRAALAAFLAGRCAVPVDPGHLLVTNGASQALDLVCTLFTRAGDAVLVEEPTYFLALKIFADHRLRLRPLPMDAGGLRLDAAAEALRRERPALLYTIPAYQNPTGATLAAERRAALAALCRESGALLVADEVYHLLAFGAPPPPPLASLAAAGGIVSLGSFSKILAPGLRLGWLHAGSELIARFVNCGLLDSGGGLNPFASGVVRSAIALGLLDLHLERLRAVYAARAAALCAALRAHLPPAAAFEAPRGGFFIWVKLPAGIDSGRLLAAAKARGVEFMPGPRFSCRGALADRLRLSFAFYDVPQLEEGAARLGAAIRSL